MTITRKEILNLLTSNNQINGNDRVEDHLDSMSFLEFIFHLEELIEISDEQKLDLEQDYKNLTIDGLVERILLF
jgi:acyl carrier protein